LKIIGLIVNPIAGMGGRVGLKGTDGDAYLLALKKGAKPVSPRRALLFLNSIRRNDFRIISAPGIMGEDIVKKSIHSDKLVKIVGEIKYPTTPEDTRRIARIMVFDENVDLLVFVGGDGTARDICVSIGTSVPVLGVPSGVKMYSAVFANSPHDAAVILEKFLEDNVEFVLREVLDIDEDAYRRDKLIIKLYCYLKIPLIKHYVQSSKTIYEGSEEDENKRAIAEYIVENMDPNTPYILGPGSTVKEINKLLGIPYTLLGVDVIINNKLIAKDADERTLLQIISKYGKAKIVVTPIGGQGFIFGRGNQQISPSIIRKVGRNNILVVSTKRKIRDIEYLRVDTGDPFVDEMLRGYIKVLIDYGRYVVKKVI